MNQKVYILTVQGFIPCEGFFDVLDCFQNENDAYNEARKLFDEKVEYFKTIDPEFEVDEDSVDELCLEFSCDDGSYFYNYEITEAKVK